MLIVGAMHGGPKVGANMAIEMEKNVACQRRGAYGEL